MTIKKAKLSKTMSFFNKFTGGSLSLAELLDAIRLGESMTHAELAEKLGISRSHLCDILKGRKAVSLVRAIEFAETLGYSKDQFARLALQTQVQQAGLAYIVSLKAA